MKLPTAGMNHGQAVFNRATAGQIALVSHNDDVEWLLPPRLRLEMKRCFSAAVDNDKQPFYQIGVKRMIALVMWLSFQQQLRPALSERLHKRYFAAATIHALLGATTEIFGLYMVMSPAREFFRSSYASRTGSGGCARRRCFGLWSCSPVWELTTHGTWRHFGSAGPGVSVTFGQLLDGRARTKNPPTSRCSENISRLTQLEITAGLPRQSDETLRRLYV
jgi:hypothetical protein